MAIAPSRITPCSFLRGSVRTCLPRRIKVSAISFAPKSPGFLQNIRMRPLLAVTLFMLACRVGAQPLPIFDAHLHYSHDAWELVPVPHAIAILRKAGLKRALISSAGDDGQQRLYQAAPDLVIPELRPYRTRGDDRHLVPRRDRDPLPRRPAAEIQVRRHRRVPPLRRGRRPAGAAPDGRARATSTTSSCTRTPTSTRSSGCSASGRRRASSGRTPASTGRSAWPRC